jgi:hypothetical protein
MPSSTSSSERQTAADRPGVAQPVPKRPIPAHPWAGMFAMVVALTLLLTGLWEWQMRRLELAPGDLGDDASAWAEQRRRVDTEHIAVAIVGDSRILFDTDFNRFAALTGMKPLQLALPGTNARPFLEDLADDPHFKGVLIVGIAETSYFREKTGLMKDALERFHHESPAQRVSFLLHRGLTHYLAFLDENYRLSRLIARLDPGFRAGADDQPYGQVWKISANTDGRYTWLWPRLEHDARLRAHARGVWLQPRTSFVGKPVTAAVIAMTLTRTRIAVAKIRARGGDVIFVRPPSAPELRTREDARLPRARGWNALLAAAKVKGIHADDVPAMHGLVIPEYSHLSRACAAVFTDAYVRRLAQLTPRIRLVVGAPSPLSPRDCRAMPADVKPQLVQKQRRTIVTGRPVKA